jgi:hypothetical protein
LSKEIAYINETTAISKPMSCLILNPFIINLVLAVPSLFFENTRYNPINRAETEKIMIRIFSKL